MRCYPTRFASANRKPIRRRDRPAIRARCDSYRRIILLRPVDVVWKIIVRRDAIKLRRRLILLGPTRTGSETDVRSTIVAVYHPFRIIWSDPEIMVVAVRHAYGCEGATAIYRLMKTDVQNIDGVFILCIGVNSVVVPRALAYRSTLTYSLPCFASVV